MRLHPNKLRTVNVEFSTQVSTNLEIFQMTKSILTHGGASAWLESEGHQLPALRLILSTDFKSF